jgi:hypothetical protein
MTRTRFGLTTLVALLLAAPAGPLLAGAAEAPLAVAAMRQDLAAVRHCSPAAPIPIRRKATA